MSAMTRSDPPAFVLGMTVIGLAVARALGREGIPVYGFDVSPPFRRPAFSSRFCTAAFVSPDPLEDAPGLLQLLAREAARQDEKPVLFFTDDPFVEFVGRNRAALAEHFRFAFPPAEMFGALLDKRKQLDLAQRVGLPCPRTFFPDTREDILAMRHRVQYPVIIKPHQGHLWRQRYSGEVSKGFRADSPDELVARFDEVLAAGFAAIVQSVVLGPATNILMFNAYVARDGAVLARYTGRKLRQYPVDFGNAVLCESVPEPELAALSIRFLRATGYRGPAGIEMKRDDRDGKLKFIELNARPELFHSLPLAAGVNLSLVEYLDLAGRPQRIVPPQRQGVTWWNGVRDVQSLLTLRRRGELSVYAWLRSVARARAFAVFAWDDLLPMLRYAPLGGFWRRLRAPVMRPLPRARQRPARRSA
jgi:D-aspartate ligase